MLEPKVAVCCPTYDGKNYCFDRWLEQYNNLTYNNKVLFVVDNSENRDNYKRISSLGVKCHYINPKGKPIKQILAESHEALRQFSVNCNADYMLHWEVDVFNDNPDIIEMLMRSKKAVINSMYPIRTGADRELNIMLAEDDTNLLHRVLKAFHLGSDYLSFVDGTIKPCFSGGLGLVLIRKDVLGKFKFRFMPDGDILPDWLFAHDLWLQAIYNHVDTSIYSRHENQDW